MTELAHYADAQVEEYRPRILMDPADAKALDDQLRANQLAVLRKGVDYDTIPGMGDRPTLLKPGAEKLLQWFGFGFTCERDETERDSDGNRTGVTYRCTITKGLPGGGHVIVATCEGYAGYDEERFYITAERAREKAEAKEKYNAAKYNRAPRPAKWESAAEYRAPWNTVIKMAQKRALVGAAIDATAAAGLFTQDLEDMPGPAADDGEPPASQQQTAEDGWPEGAAAAPQRQNQPDGNGHHPAQDSTPRWADQALQRAAAFKTEAAGQKLWREASAAVLDGRCTPHEADHIKNLINARVADRRQDAADGILKPVAGDTPLWRSFREKILALDDDEAARGVLAEVQQAIGAGTLDDDRAKLLGRAIIAIRPKAALGGETDG